MADIVHVLRYVTLRAQLVCSLTSASLHHDTPFRLLLSVHSIKTFLSTWPITDFSVIDLHVLSGGRLRKGTSSFENVLRVRVSVHASR